MFIEWLLEEAGRKIGSFVLGEALEQLANRLSHETQQLQERIDRLDDKLERILAMQLKAALTFLELGRFEQALDELVRAEAAEPYAPVTKFWLAVVLWWKGKHDIALKKWQEALTLNPFILVNNYPVGAPADVFGDFGNHESDRTLVRNLNDQDFVRKALERSRWLPTPSAHAVVRKISCSGTHPVFSWDVGVRLPSMGRVQDIRRSNVSSGERLLTLLDESTGEALWHIRLDGEQLSYATPTVVVIWTPVKSLFKLVDANTGTTCSTMSRGYYETVFCTEERVTQSSAFQRSNVRLSHANVAIKKCLDLMGNRTPRYAGSITVRFTDTVSAEPPFGPRTVRAQASNKWHLEAFGGGH
jgi:tetratricopeptide (TPR) repeat protein